MMNKNVRNKNVKKICYSKISERDDEVICANGYVKKEEVYDLTPQALIRLLIIIRMAIDERNIEYVTKEMAKNPCLHVEVEKSSKETDDPQIIEITHDAFSKYKNRRFPIQIECDSDIVLPRDKDNNIDEDAIKEMIANAIIECSNSVTDVEEKKIEEIMEPVGEYINKNRGKRNGNHPPFNCNGAQYESKESKESKATIMLIKQLLLGGK